MEFNHQRILVSGGAGFIGSHIVDRLLECKIDVVVLDNLSGGRLENIRHHIGERNFNFIQGDIRNHDLVKELVKDVDVIFHEAALVKVLESIKNPVLTNEINVVGTLNLLQAASEANVKRFIFASSCATYGDADAQPINEDCQLKPMSPYGVSKWCAENYVKMFYDVYRLQTVCLRYFNVYGPRQVQDQYSGVITKFLENLKKNRPLTIFGDGEQTRDFVHVQDIVDANMQVLKHNSTNGEVFNIASGIPTTIRDLANLLVEITQRNVKIVYSKSRKGEIKHSHADISKAKKKLHYASKITLREGLKKLARSQGTIG